MTPEEDRIPIIATYRGVGIHNYQSADRIAVVEAAIDAVHLMTDDDALFAYAADITQPPEARLFSGAKLEAMFQVATDERRVRPNFDMAKVRARVAGLSSERWRDPRGYASLLDTHPPGTPGPVEREKPLPPRTTRQGTFD
jgi:hypothetical protein